MNKEEELKNKLLDFKNYNNSDKIEELIDYLKSESTYFKSLSMEFFVFYMATIRRLEHYLFNLKEGVKTKDSFEEIKNIIIEKMELL